MSNDYIPQLLNTVESMGLKHVNPNVLSDTGNLIVHLSPYPVVARIIKLSSEDDSDFWKNVLIRELHVAEHLKKSGIPIVSYCTEINPGPYMIDGTWMTLDYTSILPDKIGELKAVDMLNEMAIAMRKFVEPLPRLGAWRNVRQAVEHLQSIKNKDDRVSRLLEEFTKVDLEIHQCKSLLPSHGDAHPKNLVSTPSGWRWIDFEDASLMPKFWDVASFIGNKILLHDIEEPMTHFILNQNDVLNDKAVFQFALKARVVMSTIMNLSLAMSGDGDSTFSISQLDHLDHFFTIMEDELLFK
ncbi:phosphotransferase [Sporolactobacillus shoreae]|nr:phosphotransferase [Sporolactobacillus shoreae]